MLLQVAALGSETRPPPRPIPVFEYDLRAEHWLTPENGFDMTAALQRYSTDERTLSEYYNSPLSSERTDAFLVFDKTWLKVLDEVPFDSLDAEGRIDWILLSAHLRQDSEDQQQHRQRLKEIAPLIPFADLIVGLDDDLRRLIFVGGAESASKMTALADQIGKLTADVKAGRLTASPSAGRRAVRVTESLRRTLTHWHKFYDGYDPSFTWWTAEPWKRVDGALTAYATLVGEKIVGVRAEDKDTIVGDPVGRAALEKALAAQFVSYTPEELIAKARQELAWCQGQMIRNSRELGYGDDWHKALEHVKDDYVKPGEQPAKVRDLEYESIDFVNKHDLITIPESALNSWRMEMMSPERQRINPFFTGGDLLSVSYPTEDMTAEQKIMSMRGNNIHYARATVFHEVIPGHFLEEYMQQRYRPWRMAFENPFWNEGWAFYWETLLWDLDFARSPEDRIGMLFWRMHRAARVIFSLSFHLGRMTAPQAVTFLIKEVGHEPANAAAEVRRSFETDDYGPLYQAAYEIGAFQFRALHEELVKSGQMSNRQFHDSVLRLGPIPVEMVRASLLNRKLPRDFKSEWKFYDELPAPRAGTFTNDVN